jgi:hypothetical protein
MRKLALAVLTLIIIVLLAMSTPQTKIQEENTEVASELTRGNCQIAWHRADDAFTEYQFRIGGLHYATFKVSDDPLAALHATEMLKYLVETQICTKR